MQSRGRWERCQGRHGPEAAPERSRRVSPVGHGALLCLLGARAAGRCAALCSCTTAAGTQDQARPRSPARCGAVLAHGRQGQVRAALRPVCGPGQAGAAGSRACSSASPRTVRAPASLTAVSPLQPHPLPHGRSPKASAAAGTATGTAGKGLRQPAALAGDAVLLHAELSSAGTGQSTEPPRPRVAPGPAAPRLPVRRGCPPAALLAQPARPAARGGAGGGSGPSCGGEEGAAGRCPQLRFLEMKKTEGRES